MSTATLSHSTAGPAAPNAYRLLWAGFTAILAAGMGFAIRGGILDNWGSEFGFTDTQLGKIGGAGFTGFCFGIIVGGVVADKIGYGKLVIAAFLFHVLSAFVTFAAVPGTAPAAAYTYLFWGTFLFAVANGTLEAVANPLVACLFPNNRTHYLNILHASWPAGMIAGASLGWVLDDLVKLHWIPQLALFLIPTVAYGFMFLGQSFPKSEASEKGLSLGDMMKDVGILGGLVVCGLLGLFFQDTLKQLVGPNELIKVDESTAALITTYGGWVISAVLLFAIAVLTKFSVGSLLLFVLFIVHAMVGAVELGTDGWIQNITGNILSSSEGKYLFVFTSLVMFSLRFCADFIEKKIGLSPVGILFVCAILACVGLNLASRIDTFTSALLAMAVYGFGKTFFWPTMLAVASDRFPRTGAVAISIMGGIGMMSAGLLGSVGLGFSKDYYSGESLKTASPAAFAEYKAEKPSQFLFLEGQGLDAKKVGEIKKIAPADQTADQKAALAAGIEGDRKTLVADSFIPATMAVIYLGLLIYFAAIGGYKPVKIEETHTA
jgi:MFS family permease